MDLNYNFKIAHCIASMDANAGGTTTAVLDILKEQSKYVDLELFTLNSKDQIQIPIIGLDFFSEKISFLDYSIDLGNKMRGSKADLFHNHALWNLPMHQMAVYARKIDKPYLISVHGMLEPWSLMQGKLKKNIAMKLYQRIDLERAFCIHATANSEAQNIRNLGFKNPIAIIPNGINTVDYPLKKQTNFSNTNRKKILFLSRIHYKKGIEMLIDAWSYIPDKNREEWEVEIVGSGDMYYIDSLKKKITDLNLQHQIKISEPKYGNDKIETYHSADLFVLPTYSENFGMVIAEALSCGVPVITTKGTPWKDLEEYNAGSWIDIGVKPLKSELEKYLQKNSSEIKNMGLNGRRLVEEKCSIESVGAQFKELYSWILSKSEKPDFVI